jgi:hypothetical protein
MYEEAKKLKRNKKDNKILKFINKPPKWNKEISAYALNFRGRATISSVKNFIITKEG